MDEYEVYNNCLCCMDCRFLVQYIINHLTPSKNEEKPPLFESLLNLFLLQDHSEEVHRKTDTLLSEVDEVKRTVAELTKREQVHVLED